MELINPTPLVAATVPLQVRRDGHVLLIVVKGTFEIRTDGRLRLADDPLPVFFGDEYNDPEAGGSVKFEADLAPFKPRTDIVLVGQAHAPLGRPTQRLDVSLRVGTLARTIAVFGDRHWLTEGSHPTISAPAPFTTLPLLYERAFGGVDSTGGGVCATNPVGRGFLLQRPERGQHPPLPNLEHPERLIQWWQDQPPPVGFGFYGKSWQPRVGWLGTYDERWQRERAPGPPADFRSDYFNGAHPDLQVAGYLRGDEPVELINLNPAGRLRWQLPGLHVSAQVRYHDHGAGAQPLELRLDTLCLLPEQRRFYQVWRGHCAIADLTAATIDQVAITAQRSS